MDFKTVHKGVDLNHIIATKKVSTFPGICHFANSYKQTSLRVETGGDEQNKDSEINMCTDRNLKFILNIFNLDNRETNKNSKI